MTHKQPDFSELNQLAIEACDMWQEHLSTLASNPDARAELTKFLEPQRRLFADWAGMMQQGMNPNTASTGGNNHESSRTQNKAANASPNDTTQPAAETASPATSAAAKSGGVAYGDDSLRVAQLALRVAELEKRLARLESTRSSGTRKTQRTAS